MFEVGKLTDESLDSFLGELEKASIDYSTFLLSLLIVKIMWN